MSETNTTRWIGAGLLGPPLYGALTFRSSMNPQPDPETRMAAWSTISRGVALDAGGFVAMVTTVPGTALFLPVMGVSAFAAPEEG